MRSTHRHAGFVLSSILVLGSIAGCGNNNSSGGPVASGAASPGAAAPGASSGIEDFNAIPRIVAQVDPSVVTVIRPDAQGSGVVWSRDGMIVTNNHVVEGTKQVVIAFADGVRANGSVLATDPLSDLAVVKANRANLPPATFADALPPVGSLTIAIGNPLGFENSVTQGVLSGTGRAIPGAAQQSPALVDLLQTDAAISPGNSGGALVGGDGKVIGINVAYIPPSASAVAIGFAIPAPTVTDVVKQLVDKGRAVHAYLGIQPAELTPQIAQQFGLKADSGVLVVDVPANTPAGKAGLQPGDVIAAIDGKQVTTVEELLSALRQHKPGDQITLHIVRGGAQQDVKVTLGDFPR
jgi:serine protease DegQ